MKFGWIDDEAGDITKFAESYYFNMQDIVFESKEECPLGLILAWQDSHIEKEKEYASDLTGKFVTLIWTRVNRTTTK